MPNINREFWALPIFAGISLAYATWLEEPVLWFLVYLCLGCIALAMLYRWRNWKLVKLTRSFRSEEKILEAGSDLRIVLWAETTSYLPWPWLELRDNLPGTLEKHLVGQAGGHMVWARRGSVQYTSYTLKNLPRGIHNWDSVWVNSGDPLGLISYRGKIQESNQLVVYPKTVELGPLNFFPRRIEGAVMAKKAVNQGATQFVGIREYRPGDRLSLIHWKSTAKTSQLQSKEFDPLLMNSSLIILDCSADAWQRDHDPDFEEAVSVAASLVKAALLQRIPVRFRSNYGNKNEQLSVSNQSDYFRLLLHLAAIAPTGRSLLSQSLYGEIFIQDSNVVIVTSGRGEEVREILYRISARGNAVTVITVNSQAGNGPRPRLGQSLNMLRISKAEDLSPGQGKKDVN